MHRVNGGQRTIRLYRIAPLAGLLAALSFAVAPQAPPADHPTDPPPPMAFPSERWEEATPHSQGVDPARLREAIDSLSKHCGADGVRQLVIVRNGRLIHAGDDADNVHGVWSVTKSFTSTTLGLLIADGKCELDTPAGEHLPAMNERYLAVTFRHLVTMTSGYRAAGDEPKGGYLHGPSETPFTPGEPLFAPGEQFAYWDSAMNQLGHALTRIAGEPLEDLFRRRVADPIGMDDAKREWCAWGEVDGLVVNGGSGNHGKSIHLSARELARLGHLFLNRGKWGDKQLIEEQWVRAATSVQVAADLPWAQPESNIDGRGVYGFNWWVNGTNADGKRKWPSAPEGTFAAVGHNNNVCFVVPEWAMVIVRLGTDGNVAEGVWDEFLGKVAAAVEPTPPEPQVAQIR